LTAIPLCQRLTLYHTTCRTGCAKFDQTSLSPYYYSLPVFSHPARASQEPQEPREGLGEYLSPFPTQNPLKCPSLGFPGAVANIFLSHLPLYAQISTRYDPYPSPNIRYVACFRTKPLFANAPGAIRRGRREPHLLPLSGCSAAHAANRRWSAAALRKGGLVWTS